MENIFNGIFFYIENKRMFWLTYHFCKKKKRIANWLNVNNISCVVDHLLIKMSKLFMCGFHIVYFA